MLKLVSALTEPKYWLEVGQYVGQVWEWLVKCAQEQAVSQTGSKMEQNGVPGTLFCRSPIPLQQSRGAQGHTSWEVKDRPFSVNLKAQGQRRCIQIQLTKPTEYAAKLNRENLLSMKPDRKTWKTWKFLQMPKFQTIRHLIKQSWNT